jgi:hypothetical protein
MPTTEKEKWPAHVGRKAPSTTRMPPGLLFDIPEDVDAARDGLIAFAANAVIPPSGCGRGTLCKSNYCNLRCLYQASGRLPPEALAIISDVRAALAKADFYHVHHADLVGGGLVLYRPSAAHAASTRDLNTRRSSRTG